MPTNISDRISEMQAELEEIKRLPPRSIDGSFDFSEDTDVSESIQIMDPMAAAAYQLIADHATDMISVHSDNGRYVFVSSACRRLLGFNAGELIGLSPHRLGHPEEIDKIAEYYFQPIDNVDLPSITYRLRCRNGTYRWVETTSRIHVSHTGMRRIIAITRDVSERERLVRQLEESNRQLMAIASRDELTGVANRRAFNERLSYLTLDFHRGRIFSLVVGDIDKFKLMNDTYGHQAGDKIIGLVAQALANECRSIDMVARYGGEEFAILLPGTNEAGALALAERAREAISNIVCQYGQVTMSFGVCTSSSTADNEHDIFSFADRALYTAKSNGRNRVHLHRS